MFWENSDLPKFLKKFSKIFQPGKNFDLLSQESKRQPSYGSKFLPRHEQVYYVSYSTKNNIFCVNK